MVEDGFQKACDDEAQDWWMPLFGMAPCQALMSLYTVNRWPTSPEFVSVFTLSFWLSPSSLSSLLHLFCRPLLHLYTLKTLSQDRAKTANTSSSIKILESLFQETAGQAFSCLQCRRGRKKPCLSRCCSWRRCPCGFLPGTSWQRQHITTTICTTATVRLITMPAWTISFLQRYLWWRKQWPLVRSTSVAPFMGSCLMQAAPAPVSIFTSSFKKTQVSPFSIFLFLHIKWALQFPR